MIEKQIRVSLIPMCLKENLIKKKIFQLKVEINNVVMIISLRPKKRED